MKRLQLSDLSLGELERVQKTLERRFGIGHRGNILQIGFGIAEFEQRGELDWARPAAVCFYVSKKTKSQPRNRRDRIPTEIRVRIRRGDSYCQLVAPTDVIVYRRSRCSLSGRTIVYGNHGIATTGVLLAWRPRGRTRLTWGVLSVGHTFPEGVPLPDEQVQVRMGGPPSVPGRFLARGNRSHLDTSLSIVRKNDLIRSGVIPEGFRPAGMVVRTVDDLRQDAGAFGNTLPDSTPLPFQVYRFLVSAPLFRSELGFSPRHVLHVGQAVDGSFRTGTSGSAWRINQQAACLQFGTYRPRFNEGFGHSLESVVEWVRESVGGILEVATGEVEIRVVAVF